MTDTPDTRVLLQAEGLGFAIEPGGRPVLRQLDLVLRPGLTLVRGDEGTGKSTLLRLLAGQLAPTAGRLRGPGDAVQSDEVQAEADDEVPVQQWLALRRARHAGWQAATEQALLAGFALQEHLHKRLAMLSTGSRRKVGLVAAAASGAALTLLDTPFAALDAPSSRVLAGLLAEAAASRTRAWVVADYGLPALLAGVPLAAEIDLDAAAAG